MGRLYTVEINYKASVRHVVEADDEGMALDKARMLAEESDITDFVLTSELESKIIEAR